MLKSFNSLNENWGRGDNWNKKPYRGNSITGFKPPKKYNSTKNKETEYEILEEKPDLSIYPISDLFLKLTKVTTPNGNEKLMEPHLPIGWKNDSSGNYYYVIGKNSSVMFTCHLDTADKDKSKEVKHVMKKNSNGDILIATDGKTILGADDKAGVAIMIHMIEHGIPGLYYFFLGEERGCIGSRGLLKEIEKNKPISYKIKKIISFDRKGYDDIITKQSGKECCSDIFADSLSLELNRFGFNYKKDPTGMYTDSYTFINTIEECTNISVGYFHQHSNNEVQDISFLQKLADACLKVNWENLPVVRDKRQIIDLRPFVFKCNNKEEMLEIMRFLEKNEYTVFDFKALNTGKYWDPNFSHFAYNYKDAKFYRVNDAYVNQFTGKGKYQRKLIEKFSDFDKSQIFLKSNFVDEMGNEKKK